MPTSMHLIDSFTAGTHRELHFEIRDSHGQPTGITRHVLMTGKEGCVSDTLHFGQESFDLAKNVGTAWFDWIEERASRQF
jgi:hypothetical protein